MGVLNSAFPFEQNKVNITLISFYIKREFYKQNIKVAFSNVYHNPYFTPKSKSINPLEIPEGSHGSKMLILFGF